FLILYLNLLCSISQVQSMFVSESLWFIQCYVEPTQIMQEERLSLMCFPKDYHTILRHFNLDPQVQLFICCPLCCALYDNNKGCLDFCTFQDFPSSPPCSVCLKQTRVICGTSV
ncbi:hypothetical protein EV401DRAFT_1809354, partial [Pisolithus croceorrhizus]